MANVVKKEAPREWISIMCNAQVHEERANPVPVLRPIPLS